MIIQSLEIDPGQLAERTGWEVKPQGACKEERCVPLPKEVKTAGGKINLEVLANRLNMPIVRHDPGLMALGPESGGKALTSAIAPDFSLPDLEGKLFRLSSLRGRKVLLVAWASW